MGRRWLQSVDLETDENGRPRIEKAILALDGALTSTTLLHAAASADLPTLLGVTLPAKMKLGFVVSPLAEAYWRIGGAATREGPPLTTRSFPVDKAVADTIQILVVSGTVEVLVAPVRN